MVCATKCKVDGLPCRLAEGIPRVLRRATVNHTPPTSSVLSDVRRDSPGAQAGDQIPRVVPLVTSALFAHGLAGLRSDGSAGFDADADDDHRHRHAVLPWSRAQRRARVRDSAHVVAGS